MRILQIKSKLLKAQRLNVQAGILTRFRILENINSALKQTTIRRLKATPSLPMRSVLVKQALQEDLIRYARLQKIEEKIQELSLRKARLLSNSRETAAEEEVMELKVNRFCHSRVNEKASDCHYELKTAGNHTNDLAKPPNALVCAVSDGLRTVQIESTKFNHHTTLFFTYHGFSSSDRRRFRETIVDPLRQKYVSIRIQDESHT